jgi:hypothetical protein
LTASRHARQSPRPRRPPPDRVTSRSTASLAPLAFRQPASPTSPSLRPPSCRPDRLAHRSPVAVAPRHRLCAGEPPFPRRLPCAGADPPPARRAAPPPSHTPPGSAAARSRRAPRAPAPAEVVGRASAAHVGCAPRGRGPRRALCIWAKCGFGPVAPG